MNIKYKQFVIVPESLRMSAGKIASQVAHATFMALKKDNKAIVDAWEKSGMCVIVLKCKDTQQLMSASKYFEQWKVNHHLYIDEGHTEVEPLTPTALATGVLDEDCHWMLSQFKLYDR